MIDIAKGRYWSEPWSLVSGCTRCSPGCDHCWSLAMEKRFHRGPAVQGRGIHLHPDRLTIPLKRRKPTVYAVWNDLFHEAVPDSFIGRALSAAIGEYRHTFLVLTKRAERMASLMSRFYADAGEKELRRAINVWSGLTVCNQAEADAKIPVFLQVPGKKFLSVEPMLGEINLRPWMGNVGKILDPDGDPESSPGGRYDSFLRRWVGDDQPEFDAVILGGETGSGARPMHPDWVRSVRDQCAAAGVPFFFKGWGEWAPSQLQMVEGCVNHTNGHYWYEFDPSCKGKMKKLGRKCGRLLDGRTHDDLPWVTK